MAAIKSCEYCTICVISQGRVRLSTSTITSNLGTNATVCSWICVSRLKKPNDETNDHAGGEYRAVDQQGHQHGMTCEFNGVLCVHELLRKWLKAL